MININFTWIVLLSLFCVSSAFAKANISYDQERSLVWDSYKSDIRDLTMQGHSPLPSYKTARMVLFQKVELEKDNNGYFLRDVYCNRIIRHNVGPTKMPSHTIINVEHTWPQSQFNDHERKITQKTDLHHLYPTDSKANGARGHLKFGEFGESGIPLRNCAASKRGRIAGTSETGFEPPLEQKGNVARALFYFSIRYRIAIASYEEVVLRQWHLLDPVDDAERERNNTVETAQGNRNPFIDEPEYTDLISDF